MTLFFPEHRMTSLQRLFLLLLVIAGCIYCKVGAASDFLQNIQAQNAEAMVMLSSLLHDRNGGWKIVGEKDGVTVERRYLDPGSYVAESDRVKSGKHACVRSVGFIKAPAEAVFNLFIDNSRVSEYNEHCIELKDIAEVHRHPTGRHWTKISWARSPKYGPMKARDFSSVVNFNIYPNGTFIILNRPAYHSATEPTNQYVRATILLAANVIEPIESDKCKFTQIAHINPGGVADTPAAAWIINKLCAVGPPTFMRRLELAAQKPTSFPLKNPIVRNVIKNCIYKLKTAINTIQPQKPSFFKNVRLPVAGLAFRGGIKGGSPSS